MNRQEKLKNLKLKQELNKALARLKAKSLKGTVTCFNCWEEWPAVMSVNEEKKIPFGKMMCLYCHEQRGLFVEDKWETNNA